MYKINDGCPNCGACNSVCPVGAIKFDGKTFISSDCIDCGICVRACPVKLIVSEDNNKTAKTEVKKTDKKEE